MSQPKTFEQYAAWLKTTVYEEDPLLMLANRTGIDAPGDNELIVLSASPSELEKMLLQMKFVPKPNESSTQRTEQWGTAWTREPVTLSRRTYLLTEGLTYAQILFMDQPQTLEIRQDDETVSFLGRGRKVGEMVIHTAVTLHPYNRDSEKSIPPEEYRVMKEVYARNAQKKVGDSTVQELLQDTYFGDSHRIFADEFLFMMEHLAKQDYRAVFQHYKAPYLIAVHNVDLQ